jgi:hypothetical protein
MVDYIDVLNCVKLIKGITEREIKIWKYELETRFW